MNVTFKAKSMVAGALHSLDKPRTIRRPFQYATASDFFQRLKFLEESQWWTREEIKIYQEKKRVLLVLNAFRNIPFYHKLYSREGLADPDLFRSRSSPSVGKIGRIVVDGQPVWTAFFVSGKNHADMFPSIYMINVADGSVVERVMLDDDESGRGGVPSGQPTIIDSDGNGFIDRLYIGTDKGFMYKVNIPDDPAVVYYGFNNCVINDDYDFYDKAGAQQSVGTDNRYAPIYGSPVVLANNGVDIKIMYGTGDSPFYDEDIDFGNTRYHFFTYHDEAQKGVCDSSQVELDWFLEMEAGHRIFASAFAAAGKIYFGTATTNTEDPCDTPSGSGSQGYLYYIDIVDGPPEDDPETTEVDESDLDRHTKGQKSGRKDVGNTVITPVVYDQHVYVKNSAGGIIAFGDKKHDNEREESGFPTLEIHAWREFF
jgi:hypothetical protein